MIAMRIAALPRLLVLSGVVLLSIGSAVSRCAAGDFVIRAGRVYASVNGANGIEAIDDGIIIVRDGKIAALGPAAELAMPNELAVREFPDSVVTAGLVCAHSDLAGRHTGDESIGPDYRALDAYDSYGRFPELLAAGVTTVHLNPGTHRLLTGRGAVVKLGGPLAERVVSAASDLTISFGVYGPGLDIEVPFPANPEAAIEPSRRQRPSSRMSAVQAIDAALGDAASPLARVWRERLPLRIHADEAIDLIHAVEFVHRAGRGGYLVGGRDFARVADELAGASLVYRPDHGLGRATPDVPPGTPLSDPSQLAQLGALRVALAPAVGDGPEALRLTGVLAYRAGWPRARVLAAMTQNAAAILGVDDRVGRLAQGHDADLVVWNADPLIVGSNAELVFIGGEEVYRARRDDVDRTLIVRAGTLWVSPDRRIRDGEMLIVDGKVRALGPSVPHPRGVSIIDAGPHAFVTPGFIDGRSHLGFEGDRRAAGIDLDIAALLGVPGEQEARVAAAGITTVLVSPYQFSNRGSRFSAVKTAGRQRQKRLIAGAAGVALSLGNSYPGDVGNAIRGLLTRGRRYVNRWQKYRKDLAEYEEKKRKGEDTTREVVEEVVEGHEDPITGIWEGTAVGGPLTSPRTGKVSLRLDGAAIEGRVVEPPVSIEHRIIATLDGKTIDGKIEVDTGGLGTPRIHAELIEADHFKGYLAVAGIRVQFEARRIDKAAVEFSVTRRTSVETGAPKAPRVDIGLEPFFALFDGKIPLVIEATSAAQVDAVLDTVIDREKLRLVLLNANASLPLADRLAAAKVGVVLPQVVTVDREREFVYAGAELEMHGVATCFQSQREDGARALPAVALRAVEEGMSADGALAAMTAAPAKMFGIDGRVGTLEVGKDADLLIFDGHPFANGARLERVIIDGLEVDR